MLGVYRGVALPAFPSLACEPGWAGGTRDQALSSVSPVAVCCHLLPNPFVAGFPPIPGLCLQGVAGHPAVERVAGEMQADIA